MSHHEFSIVGQDGFQLFAQEWISESAPKGVLVLIHGLGEHSNRYTHLANWFNDHGYHVISMDLRGHGKTAGARGHIPGYQTAAQDIGHLVKTAVQKYPALPTFLYGHSLGGALALYYSLTQPISSLKGVIATSPGLVPANPPSAGTLFVAKIANRIAPKMLIENGLDRGGLARDPEVEKRYSADTLVHGKISARLGMELIQNGQKILEKASQLTIPLLLMVGTADRLVNVDAVRKFSTLAPKSMVTFKEWEGFYHELHNEPEKELVFQTVLRWIEQHT